MVGVVELVAVLGTWRVRTSHGTSVMRESQELSRQGRDERSVLLTLFVFRRPPVPALNKWTTLFPPLSYWCVATNLTNIIGRMWEMVFTEKKLKKQGADSGTTQM